MCQAWEEMREDAKETGERAGKLAFVRKMLEAGRYTVEEIAELSEFSVDEVKALAMELKKK